VDPRQRSFLACWAIDLNPVGVLEMDLFGRRFYNHVTPTELVAAAQQ